MGASNVTVLSRLKSARPHYSVSLLATFAVSLWLPSASAAAGDDVRRRLPLPESLLTESTTDIDADEAGELEYEANLARLGARKGGAFATLASVEVEWRALRHLGLRLEPTCERITPSGATRSRNELGVSGAIAFTLWHDFPHDQHLQLELLGRTPDRGAGPNFDPGETELPGSLNLVAAQRYGQWTLRATAGAELGGHFAHAPFHTDLSALTGIASDARFGYLALEVRADWASPAPLVIAPEVISDLVPLSLPFRIGLALPVNVGAGSTTPSYGMFMRVILLTERERLSEAAP
jgi:hypothetical protein